MKPNYTHPPRRGPPPPLLLPSLLLMLSRPPPQRFHFCAALEETYASFKVPGTRGSASKVLTVSVWKFIAARCRIECLSSHHRAQRNVLRHQNRIFGRTQPDAHAASATCVYVFFSSPRESAHADETSSKNILGTVRACMCVPAHACARRKF